MISADEPLSLGLLALTSDVEGNPFVEGLKLAGGRPSRSAEPMYDVNASVTSPLRLPSAAASLSMRLRESST